MCRCFTYLRVKVGNSGGLNVFLAQHLHFDRRVGEVEGKVVQEVGQVGRCTVHHSQGVGGCTSGLLGKGQLQELLGEALHLSRAETGQLVGVGVQDRPPAVGLTLLVHEASIAGARLEAGAADVVVLVGEEGYTSQFEGVEVGQVVLDGVSASLVSIRFVLHRTGQRRLGTDAWQSEVSSEPCTYSLHRFVVHVPDLLRTVLLLTVLLLLLFLLQEIFLQC